MITRRKILSLGISALPLVWAGAVRAQQAARIYRIGLLSVLDGRDQRYEAMLEALKQAGFVDGRNLKVEWRFARGNRDLQQEYAAELARLNVDCIVSTGLNATRNALQATRTIPIVMANSDADPVEAGIVASLARPGGNVTGFTGIAHDLAGKRLDLLKETAPKASRLAVLANGVAQESSRAHVAGTEAAAKRLNMQVLKLEPRGPQDLDGAFKAAQAWRADAISIIGVGWINNHRARIIGMAERARLPAVYSNDLWVNDGGLMSYADDQIERYKAVGEYVARVLRGARPADLPVQQPTKLELTINLKTAKALGLTIPQLVLVRATRVIE